MSLYMRWPFRNFYTFNHLVDSYRNKISEWAVGFRYGNFTWKLARGKKSLASRGPTALGRQAFLLWRWRNFHTWNSADSEILYFYLRSSIGHWNVNFIFILFKKRCKIFFNHFEFYHFITTSQYGLDLFDGNVFWRIFVFFFSGLNKSDMISLWNALIMYRTSLMIFIKRWPEINLPKHF